MPLALGPVLGWNTWCTQNACAVDWCTSREVINIARAMKDNGLQSLGYEWINLDDCWGLRNETSGKIYPDPDRFPEGMTQFIEKLHKMNFKVGVYTDMGENACTSPFTGSWPYYEQDVQDFSDWGVDYIKYDYCGPPEGYTPQELTANFSEVVKSAQRDMWLNFHCDEMTWEDSRCGSYGESFRIAPDHVDRYYSTIKISKYLQDRKQWWGPPSLSTSDKPLAWPDADFVYTGGEGCGEHSKPGERCPGQTDTEYISEFSVWAISSGSLLFATDPRNMSDVQRAALFNTEILDVFRDETGFDSIRMIGDGRPPHSKLPLESTVEQCDVRLQEQLSHADCIFNENYGCVEDTARHEIWVSDGCRGLFECYNVSNIDCENDAVCPCRPELPQVWVRPIENGKYVAVVMFNAADETNDVYVAFKDLPASTSWGNDTTLAVRDLWAHADVGSSTGKDFCGFDLVAYFLCLCSYALNISFFEYLDVS